ncbi:MAG: GEVED domain-containing protein, partial [Planctomycetota bacterium]
LEGSSVSHLDTDNVNYSDRTHLMVHAFGQGTVTRDLHPIEVAMLEDLGYDMTIETDPGNPGYSVVAGGSTVNESGTQVSFSVQLDEQPSSNVQIVVSSSDTTELIVSPVAITFTPSNWNTPQTVTATGVEDGLVDGDQVSSVIFAINDAVSDDAFDSLPNQSFPVTTVDENVPGLQLTVDGGTTVSEFGTSTAIDVQLTSPPDQDVVIEVTNPAPDEVALNRSRLTFTAANWNVPQTVTVTGVNDGIVDGDQTTLLSFAVLPSVSDPLYVGVDAETVSIVTTDAVANGDQGFVVTNNGSGTVSEDGTEYEFFVELDSAPASPVVITVTPSDPTEVTLSRFSLIFTAANWNVPQGVTVRGVDDGLFDGDQLSEITLAVDADNSDPAFWSSPTQTLSVVTEDNENAAVVVTAPPTAQITEQTSTNFQVQLGGSPEAPVVIRLTANDGGQSISLSQNQLVFTSDNWNVPRVVTLAGVEDGVVDGDQQVMITVAVDTALSDPGFAVVPDQQFSIEVLDVDEVTPPELDFGDAGGTFPTRLEDDGARHVAEGPTLGSSRDTEANSDGAAGVGDDLSQLDDEDGVIAPTVYLGRTSFDLSILAGNVGSSAFLDAWIDFDGDGSWQASEQIMASVLLQEGENVFSIVVPEGLSPGSRMARFRISSTGGLTTTGWAANGEVEDHAIVFANSDWHNVDRPLDVNGNDGAIPTPLDALAIVNELTNHVYSDPVTFELPPDAAPPLFLDVDNNGLVNPLDALLVISGLPSLGGSLAVALPGVSLLPLEARAVVEHASLELPVPGGLESPPLSLPRPLDRVPPPSPIPSIAEAHEKTAASIDRCFADVDWHESLGG